MEVWLHWDGSRVLWAIARCETCGTVVEFLGSDAATSVLRCDSCGSAIDLREQVRPAMQRE
jgi:DNA-directed RNA polymerase subunit RPC12/RpoP